MKIRKINDKEVDSDMSFNKMELLMFCVNNTLNNFYENDEFLHEVFWSLFNINIEEVNYESGTKDNYFEVETDGKIKIKNVNMIYNDIILKCEKLSQEILENQEKFKSKMILFDYNK